DPHAEPFTSRGVVIRTRPGQNRQAQAASRGTRRDRASTSRRSARDEPHRRTRTRLHAATCGSRPEKFTPRAAATFERLRLDALDARKSVARATNRRHPPATGGFRTRRQTRLSEVQPVELVDLERTKKHRLVDHPHRREPDHRSRQLSYALAWLLVER